MSEVCWLFDLSGLAEGEVASGTERVTSGVEDPPEVTARTGSGTRCALAVTVVCLVSQAECRSLVGGRARCRVKSCVEVK